jgi:hypothetical protein
LVFPFTNSISSSKFLNFIILSSIKFRVQGIG